MVTVSEDAAGSSFFLLFSLLTEAVEPTHLTTAAADATTTVDADCLKATTGDGSFAVSGVFYFCCFYSLSA